MVDRLPTGRKDCQKLDPWTEIVRVDRSAGVWIQSEERRLWNWKSIVPDPRRFAKTYFAMEGDRRREVCMMSVLNLLLCVVFMLLCASGASADGNVTLDSLTIYTTHEWFGRTPTIYFRCGQENKVYLPDVVHKDQEYLFIGQESWQPLTTLYGEKCKRCGLYEQDTVKSDDKFYAAELCPKDFATAPEGHLVLYKEKQFNATLLCPDCIPQSTTESNTTDIDNSKDSGEDEKGAGIAFVIIVLVFIILFALGVVAYTKWRQQHWRDQQARFVKMFEDDDDLDAELGLKDDL